MCIKRSYFDMLMLELAAEGNFDAVIAMWDAGCNADSILLSTLYIHGCDRDIVIKYSRQWGVPLGGMASSHATDVIDIDMILFQVSTDESEHEIISMGFWETHWLNEPEPEDFYDCAEFIQMLVKKNPEYIPKEYIFWHIIEENNNHMLEIFDSVGWKCPLHMQRFALSSDNFSAIIAISKIHEGEWTPDIFRHVCIRSPKKAKRLIDASYQCSREDVVYVAKFVTDYRRHYEIPALINLGVFTAEDFEDYHKPRDP